MPITPLLPPKPDQDAEEGRVVALMSKYDAHFRRQMDELREEARRGMRRRIAWDLGGLVALAAMLMGAFFGTMSERDELRSTSTTAVQEAKIAVEAIEAHERLSWHQGTDERLQQLRDINHRLDRLDERWAENREELMELRRVVLRAARSRQ